VPAARMLRVEAVTAEFRDIDNRIVTTRQFHPRLNLADCGRFVRTRLPEELTGLLTSG
jgi:hypothetical protein